MRQFGLGRQGQFRLAGRYRRHHWGRGGRLGDRRRNLSRFRRRGSAAALSWRRLCWHVGQLGRCAGVRRGGRLGRRLFGISLSLTMFPSSSIWISVGLTSISPSWLPVMQIQHAFRFQRRLGGSLGGTGFLGGSAGGSLGGFGGSWAAAAVGGEVRRRRRMLWRRRRGRRFQFGDNQLLVSAGGHQLGAHSHHFGRSLRVAENAVGLGHDAGQKGRGHLAVYQPGAESLADTDQHLAQAAGAGVLPVYLAQVRGFARPGVYRNHRGVVQDPAVGGDGRSIWARCVTPRAMTTSTLKSPWLKIRSFSLRLVR